MRTGYPEFPDDVQRALHSFAHSVGLERTVATPEHVVFAKPGVALNVTLVEDELLVQFRLPGCEHAFGMEHLLPTLGDKLFAAWQRGLKRRMRGRDYRGAFQAALPFVAAQLELHATTMLRAGALPQLPAIAERLRQEKVVAQQYMAAWRAVQVLPADDPVRRKYVARDASWYADMRARLESE